jgi:hypothetical protein
LKKTDVKQKLEKAVELEATKEEVQEELVAVEMTPEQRDRIVKILADEKIKAQAEEDEGKFSMSLAYQHNISGRKFGPGHNIIVPASLVGLLQYQENKQREHEMGLNQSQKRMFEVMQSGAAVPVRVK